MRAIKMLAMAALVQVAASASAQTTLVGITNQTWKYFATVGGNPGEGWQNSGFDDSAWLSGRGLFGNDTGYPYPFVSTITGPSGGGPTTTFYRTTFNWVGSTAGVVLTMTNYVDDGSVIYINGTEVTRFNMPAGVADQSTFALGSLTEPIVRVFQIDLGNNTNFVTSPLVAGPNTLAVSVHNNNATSSDTVFGLSVVGAQTVAPCFTGTQPTNRTILVTRSTTFTATEACGIPAPSFQWYRDIGAGEEAIAGATAASYTLTNAAVGDSGKYYVKATNSKGTATSGQGTLTVINDTQAPVLLSARLGTINTEIIIVADEPLCVNGEECGARATDTFTWLVINEDNPFDVISVLEPVTVVGGTVTITIDPPWAAETRYSVELYDFGGQSGVSDLFGNNTAAGTKIAIPAAASAISVKLAGSDLYTFDSGPSALEFATFTWAGANTDVGSADTMDTAVSALDIANITTRLPEVAGNPPATSTTAQYAPDTKTITTRPTSVIGNILLAHLRNDTGVAQANTISITYTLTDRATGTAEEVPGHYVYSSPSGAPNSWTRILGVSGDGVSGSKTGVVNLASSPWAAGTDMYILFADDNAVGTEGIYEIDNFKVLIGGTAVADTNAPVLTRAHSLNNTTIVLTFNEKMAASAGTTAPYSVSGATVTAAALNTAGTEVTLTTSARAVGNTIVTITGVRDASAQANLITPNPTTFSLTTVQKVVEWNTAWEYNTNNLDSAPTWKTTGGTGWLNGSALFGTETSAGVVAIMPTPIATVIPPPNTANDFMVSYFRKSITLPALAAGQSYAIGHIIDDGAVFYIDGNEIGRFNMPAGPVAHGTNALAGIEGALFALPFTATAGNHTLAVEVHQNGNTSSDMLFGAEVLVVPTVAPSLTIVHSGTNALVNWNADSSWALVGSTNVAGPYTAVGGASLRSFSRPIATPATQFYKLNYVPQP